MFKRIKEFFTGKQSESKFEHPLDAVTAPYKVPEPAATTPIPLVVEPAPAPVVETPAPVVAEAPVKKPRKPRAPKATATEKPAAKKAAPKSKKV
jgi:hypothetical protein